MTFADFANYIRKQTGTNSSTFTTPDLLTYANIYKDEMAKRIVRAKNDAFGMPEYIDLQLNNDNTPKREYPLDVDSTGEVKYCEMTFDGVKWVPLEEMDLTGYQGTTDEATIASRFGSTKGNVFFDVFRNSIFLYTAAFTAIAQGLKVWTFQWPAKFTDLNLTTDMSTDPTPTSSGFPREFQELLARRVIIAKKTEGDKPMQLTDNEQKFDQDFRTALDEYSNHGPIFAQLPEHPEFDNGFNL